MTGTRARGPWLPLLSLAACTQPSAQSADGPARIVVDELPTGVSDPDLVDVRDVRVDDADRTWVLTRFAPFVRVYDRAGGRLGAFGTAGEGPDEFGLAWALVDGGNEGIGVVDTRRGAVRYFDVDGSLVRQRPLMGGPALPPDIRRAYFGELGWTWQVATGYLQDRYAPGATLGMAQAFDFWGADLVVVPHDGSEPRTIVTFSDLVELPQDEPGARVLRPLSAGPLWDLCPGDEFVFHTGSSSEIVRLDANGDSLIRRRVELPLDPLTRDVLAEWLFEVVSRLDVPNLDTPEALRERTETMADMAAPTMEPTVPPTRLRCDPDGLVWIQLFDLEDDPLGYAREWVVLGRDGDLVAEVTFPAGFRPMRFTEDRVVGAQRGALDVETVGWVARPTIR